MKVFLQDVTNSELFDSPYECLKNFSDFVILNLTHREWRLYKYWDIHFEENFLFTELLKSVTEMLPIQKYFRAVFFVLQRIKKYLCTGTFNLIHI